MKNFKILSTVLRLDNRQTRNQRRQKDKLVPIREVWHNWVERLSYSHNHGPNVTVDNCLVGFRGRCPFRQYISSKLARYGIKTLAACDAVPSYVGNMLIYTGKLSGDNPEKNQGERVVLSCLIVYVVTILLAIIFLRPIALDKNSSKKN
ncbi:unnamed protein product [Lepeophtheirus salmonis]|uniref:(salmon louse) hypothetical protein n=1 Tax=Lepeophtheirus salmonis TaxID=72036 RepID=A0A7R8CHV2_LEPSM|nr:unnamed protein product [Lepeophtheirus salmonis]CAF2827137.1 unnamed protein product [Lepeophtheirus salmonis]